MGACPATRAGVARPVTTLAMGASNGACSSSRTTGAARNGEFAVEVLDVGRLGLGAISVNLGGTEAFGEAAGCFGGLALLMESIEEGAADRYAACAGAFLELLSNHRSHRRLFASNTSTKKGRRLPVAEPRSAPRVSWSPTIGLAVGSTAGTSRVSRGRIMLIPPMTNITPRPAKTLITWFRLILGVASVGSARCFSSSAMILG